jgi:hypothetical protein
MEGLVKSNFFAFFLAFCISLSYHALGQIINTVAGGGSTLGDSGIATNAELDRPYGVACAASGSYLISDSYNYRIRIVNANDTINTIAGNGHSGFSGDGGPATNAEINTPYGSVAGNKGNFYFADRDNHRIRVVNSSGIINTFAGNGNASFNGDHGPATAAELNYPSDVVIDNKGNVYIADSWNYCIRKVDTAGIITTVAGVGTVQGYSGDGGPATAAELNVLTGVATDTAGNIYIADNYSYIVRMVNSSGIIETIAGIPGYTGYCGDGGPATAAELSDVWDVKMGPGCNIYLSDASNYRIRMIDTSSGIITTIAGNGHSGFYGDGGPATAAELGSPNGMSFDNAGNLYFADEPINRIREISWLSTGISDSPTPNNVLVFPCPAKEEINVKMPRHEPNTIFCLYDIYGQQMLTKEIQDEINIIYYDNLPEGVYLYRIVCNGSIYKNGKLVLE